MSAQAMEALEVGNDLRLRMAAWKREVASLDYLDGLTALADALETHDPLCERMVFHRFLISAPLVGSEIAASIVRRSRVSAASVFRPVCRLKDGERARLVEELRRRVEEYR